MGQSDNLLSTFPIEKNEKHSASFWRERLSALTVGGLENYRTTLAAALESGDPAIMETAKKALHSIGRIARRLQVTHEAVEEAFGELQESYADVRKTITGEKDVKKHDNPRAKVLHDYTSLHISCHAHAAATLPELEAQMTAHRAANPEPAFTEQPEDDGALFREILGDAAAPKPTASGSTPSKAAPSGEAPIDLEGLLAESLPPTQPAEKVLTKPGHVARSKPLH